MNEHYLRKRLSTAASFMSDPYCQSTVEFNWHNLPYRQGNLLKKTHGVFGRWVSRYFVLDNLVLSYYYDSSKGILGGSLNINIINVYIQYNSSEIKIFTKDKIQKIKLKAEGQELTLKWFEDILIHIKSSTGPFAYLSQSRLLSKFSRITDQEIKKTAKTGDLLLFKGKYFSSKLQRFITKNEYDHVAILIKYGKEKIAVFDVTCEGGVSFTYWEEFLEDQPGANCKQILYRRLGLERNQRVLEKFEDFVGKVLGKKFRISVGKLFARKSDKKPEDKKGFFCSELVAMAYKSIGILPGNKPASRYWPGDFFDNKKLNLINGAYLNPGQQVEFVKEF